MLFLGAPAALGGGELVLARFFGGARLCSAEKTFEKPLIPQARFQSTRAAIDVDLRNGGGRVVG